MPICFISASLSLSLSSHPQALVHAGANPDHCNAAQDSALHILAHIAHSEAYAVDENVLKCLTILEVGFRRTRYPL